MRELERKVKAREKWRYKKIRERGRELKRKMVRTRERKVRSYRDIVK